MEIGDALVQIADKLGITVQQVYELFVSVQTAKGILIIAQIFVFIIGTYLYLSWMHKKYLIAVKENSRSDAEFIIMFGGLFGVIIYGAVIILIGNAVLQIMYPQYYGAKELIETLLRFR